MFGMYTNTTGTITWDFVPSNADLLDSTLDWSNSVLVVAWSRVSMVSASNQLDHSLLLAGP